MFPQLFDSVPDALIVIDGDGMIVLANRLRTRSASTGCNWNRRHGDWSIATAAMWP